MVTSIDQEQGTGNHIVDFDNVEEFPAASSLLFLKTKMMVSNLMKGNEPPSPKISGDDIGMELPILEEAKEEDGSFAFAMPNKNLIMSVDSDLISEEDAEGQADPNGTFDSLFQADKA